MFLHKLSAEIRQKYLFGWALEVVTRKRILPVLQKAERELLQKSYYCRYYLCRNSTFLQKWGCCLQKDFCKILFQMTTSCKPIALLQEKSKRNWPSGDAGDRTRGLSHAKRTRYHCATSPHWWLHPPPHICSPVKAKAFGNVHERQNRNMLSLRSVQ